MVTAEFFLRKKDNEDGDSESEDSSSGSDSDSEDSEAGDQTKDQIKQENLSQVLFGIHYFVSNSLLIQYFLFQYIRSISPKRIASSIYFTFTSYHLLNIGKKTLMNFNILKCELLSFCLGGKNGAAKERDERAEGEEGS